jgi:GntR family transcriptional regulator, histidine utilization repressor
MAAGPSPAALADKTTFRDVMAEIIRRITHGPWGPGVLLPNEVDLAAEFGCSRTTINRALREVSDLGFLDRRRKAGTRVRLAPIRQARFEMPIVRAEVEKTGATYRYQLLHREVVAAPGWVQARMTLTKAAQVVHVVCLHLADGTAFQLENRWISATALPAATEVDFGLVSPNEWLVATVPFSEVEVSFLATAADAAAVTHLGHALGDPVFCIERATWWQGQAITLVTLGHRPGYRMTTRY